MCAYVFLGACVSCTCVCPSDHLCVVVCIYCMYLWMLIRAGICICVFAHFSSLIVCDWLQAYVYLCKILCFCGVKSFCVFYRGRMCITFCLCLFVFMFLYVSVSYANLLLLMYVLVLVVVSLCAWGCLCTLNKCVHLCIYNSKFCVRSCLCMYFKVFYRGKSAFTHVVPGSTSCQVLTQLDWSDWKTRSGI